MADDKSQMTIFQMFANRRGASFDHVFPSRGQVRLAAFIRLDTAQKGPSDGQ